VSTSLKEKRLRILEVMSLISRKLDFQEFTRRVGLTEGETLDQMQKLEERGFLKKVGQGYALTMNGKMAIKVLGKVPEGKQFHFYKGLDQYTGFSADSLKHFYEIIKQVNIETLEFHLLRRDFENWVKTVLSDENLITELVRIRESQIDGEELRKEVLKVIEERYLIFDTTFLDS
jgi:DNA-binding Lrp family transcriptional regulator